MASRNETSLNLNWEVLGLEEDDPDDDPEDDPDDDQEDDPEDDA
jgi:hypothetical protein